MPAITISDLSNAKLDVDHIGAVANSTEPTATDRLGGVKKTMAGASADVNAKVALVEAAKNTAINTTIPAKIAEIDPVVAASYVGQAAVQAGLATTNGAAQVALAATQAGLAEMAKTQAETARDAANIIGKMATTTDEGLAATSGTGGTNRYFSTPSPDSAELLILWLNNGGVAVEQKRYTSAVALKGDVERVDRFVGYQASDYTVQTLGTTPVVGGVVAGPINAFWSPKGATSYAGALSSFSVRMGDAGTVQLLLIGPDRVVLYDQTFTGAAGLNSFPVAGPVVPAGTVAAIRPVTGSLNYGSGDYLSFIADTYSGTVGDVVAAGSDSGALISASFTFDMVAQTVKSAMANLQTEQGALSADITRHAVFLGYQESDIASESFGSVDAGLSQLAGPAVDFWGTQASLTKTGVLIGLSVRMLEAGSVQLLLVNAEWVVVFDRTFTCPYGVSTFSITDAPPIRRGGQALLRPLTGAIEYGNYDGAPTNGSSYSGVVGDVIDASVPSQVGLRFLATFTTVNENIKDDLAALKMRAAEIEIAPPSYGCDERISAAKADIAGNVVTIVATLFRNSLTSTVKGLVTLGALTGTTDVRYDVVYYDALAGTFGVQAGTVRTTDASEFIPSLVSPNHLALFNFRVSDSGITSVAVWDVEDSEMRSVAASLEQQRRLYRKAIPKTLAKIHKGAHLHIVSLADSIVAQEQGTAGSKETPNGANRDRTNYFGDGSIIGMDVINAIPLYTAVQLGRADDGIGALHHRASWVWQLVNALEAAGQPVSYDNFSIGAQNTMDLVDVNLTPSAWLNNAVALGADVVIFAMGMNELGMLLTETRVVAIINQFKAVGTEVIVVGVARPHHTTKENWEYTNLALERAARFTGSAFVSTTPIYDDKYLGVIGCASIDTCSANRINHPGINEHIKIGLQLKKLLIT